jgi:hypothetical protein
MIRQDYFLRLVQQMAQVLARVVFLKHRKEYEQALREIGQALGQFRAAQPGEGELSLEEWIVQCRKHEAAAGQLIVTVADLMQEQAELLALQNQAEQCHQARCLALGLWLEAMLTDSWFVSAELLDKVEHMSESTNVSIRPPAVLRRLIFFFEARGKFAKAEDVLFEWLGMSERPTTSEVRTFYGRLADKSDTELAQGDLPRVELEQGRNEALGKLLPNG